MEDRDEVVGGLVSWSVRIMLRRAVTQRTIIATVLAVALLGSTLLGSFALLLTSSEQRALAVTLVRAPAAATDLEARLLIGHSDPIDAIAVARPALAGITGDVATTGTDWIASPPYQLPSDGGTSVPLGYLTAVSGVDTLATLRSGAWPAAATDAAGRVEVAVPSVAATHFAWSVGSEVPMVSTSTLAAARAVVVGVYDFAGDSQRWSRDLLKGAGLDPSFPVPGSFGFFSTSAYGPFVTTQDALLGGGLEVATATLVTHPRLGTSGSELDALRTRMSTANRDVAAAVGPHVTSVTFRSALAATIDSAQGQRAVTRVSLVVVGLMLAVVALTVLLLAARLLAERRAAEQSLMASRGATGGQVLALAGLEALLVALVTTAVAPTLARALYRLTTAQPVFRRAGLDVDPHLPGVLWLTCAAASLAFAAVLLGPLVRRPTSVVDAEQQQVRQDRRGAITRSGLDVALIALAGVAYWQLREYQSPVLATGGIDAVLVAGPALFLLAGAAVALRALPLVAALAERRAARSRRLVLPLAAWELGRRPGRASGAVLLLTLAVAVGVFSQSFLATWRASQYDQADLRVGTDLRITSLATAPLEQSAAIARLRGATSLSPVAVRSVGLGAAPTSGLLASESSQVTMVALDMRPSAHLLRGSAPAGADWAAMLASIAPTDSVTGAQLPDASTALRLTVTATAQPTLPTAQLLESAVVQDARGLRVTLRFPGLAVDGAAHEVTVPLTSTPAAPLVGPLTVVALTSQVINQPTTADAAAAADPPHLSDLKITVGDLRGVRDGAATPADLGGPHWQALTQRDPRDEPDPLAVTADGGSLTTHTSVAVSSGAISGGTAGFTLTTFAPVAVLPVIASDSLLDPLGLGVGDRILLDVGGTSVAAQIAARAPYLPSMPLEAGFLVDHDLLTRTLLAQASADPLLDEWWLGADADSAANVTSAARAQLSATVTSRYELGAALTDGPLRIGVQAALWTLTGAALLLAVAGFAMSATISVRLRRLEFARLEALGASRPGLVRAVLAEHALLGGIGLVAGAVLGALLGRLVVPLLTVASDGARPVPDVVVQWPWAAEGALLALMVTLIGVAVTTASVLLLRPATSALLRLGDDR